MDRDVYAKLVAKLKGVSETIGGVEQDVETLKGVATISASESSGYYRFADSKTGIIIGINPTSNRLVLVTGTNTYYFTLTAYNP